MCLPYLDSETSREFTGPLDESPMLLRCAKILASLVHHDGKNDFMTTLISPDMSPEKTRGNIREMRLIQHILARLKHTDYQQPYLVQALAMISTAHG